MEAARDEGTEKGEQEFDKRKEGTRDTVKDMGEIVFVFWNKKKV